MSFLTAILGGLGGYMQGRQQNLQNQQQREYQQSEIDARNRQSQIEENKYRDVAQQMLANRNIDPATAQWNPQTMQYTGGQAYHMPKGWETVPTDPQQALGHYNRLMGILMGQGRGNTDIAAMTDEDRKAALAQVAAQQKFGQEVAVKQMEFQHSDWLAAYNKNTISAGEAATIGAENQRQQLTFAHQDQLAKYNHDFELAKARVPTLAMMYSGATKLPDAAANAARAAVPKIESQITNAINGLDKTNTTFQGKYITGPNPGMPEFTRTMNYAVAQLEQHPEKLQGFLNAAKKGLDAYRGGTTPGTPGTAAFTDQQHDLMVTYLTQVANNQLALRAATKATALLNQQFGVPNVNYLPPGQGGSTAPANPTYPRP